MSRPLRITGYIAIGIIAGLLIAALSIFVLTRTQWGHNRVRVFAVSWLADRVNGELRVGRVTGRGLLGGMTIHDFGIVDAKGRPFLSSDSLHLTYDWRTLLGGRIVLNRLVLYNPEIALELLPGDTLWNFEHVFRGQAPSVESPKRRLILFHDARIINGIATVRTPFRPNEAGDTARLILDELPGGTARAMRFDNIHATLPRVIWESPLEKGRLFQLQSLQARGFVWRDPFRIENARGTLTTRDSIVAFDMPEVELPSSRAAVLGRVVRAEGRNRIDVRVQGTRFAFRDLRFLKPDLPDEGGGSLVLRVQTQPDGILWLAQDARLSMPGTNVSGTFGVVTGDRTYFTQVDLRASPLDIKTLERLLPVDLPVEGLLVGTVEVRGPLSALETSGDVRLAGDVPGAGSALAWRGTFDVSNGGVAARSLQADIKRLELALLSAFNPAVQLGGTVSGRVGGSGRAHRMQFTGSLDHVSSAGGRSHVDAGGTIEGSGRNRRLDLTVNTSAVTLQDLARQVPALHGLQGELAGLVRLDGTRDDMAVRADLATSGGSLLLNGRVQNRDGVRRITAAAEALSFHLEPFRAGLPETVVSGTLDLDLHGNDLATMAGPLRVLLDSTRFADLPSSQLTLHGSFGNGLLALDTVLLHGPVGTLSARGTVAVAEHQHGLLEVGFTSESLTVLEPFAFRGQTAREDGSPRLAGRIDVSGTATGWLRDLSVTARAGGEDLVYGGLTVARLDAAASGEGLGSAQPRLQLTATGDSVVAWSHPLRTARLDAAGSIDSVAIVAHATDGGTDTLSARGDVQRAAGAISARLDHARIGGASPWLLSSPARLVLDAGVAHLDSLVLERPSGGRAVVAGQVGWARDDADYVPLDFRLRLSEVPFADVLRAVRSAETGGGLVNASLRVSGTATDPRIEGELAARAIAFADVRIDEAFAELAYSAEALDAHAEAQYGGRSILTGGGRIPLDLRFMPVPQRRLDQPLRVTVSADSLPAALPLGLLDGFTTIAGRLDGTITIGGTTVDPALSGGVALRNAAAHWSASGVRYRDVNGSFTLERDRVLRVDVSARTLDPRGRSLPFSSTASGSVRAVGTLDFTRELADPRFDLRIDAREAVAARRRDVEADITGSVALRGQYSRPEVSGSLAVDRGALYIEELYRQYLLAGINLEDPSLLSLVDTALVAVQPLLSASNNPFLKNLQVPQMDVVVGADSWLRSRDMDVAVSGNLNVTFDRRDEDLRLTGSLNVERGTYTLYYPPLQSRRFQVRRGSIDFLGTPGIDPNLSITASYKARAEGEPLEVLAMVSGTLRNPRVRLASDEQPPISESDLASYLFFGVPTWKVASAGVGDLGGSALAGLGQRALTPSVLGYASSGLQTLVQSAGLFDYVSLTAAETAPSEQNGSALTSLFAGTQLELGRFWGRNSSLYFGATQRLGTSNNTPAVRLQWRFLREYSLEMFADDRFARTPGFGLRQEIDARRYYGFLLFREWGF